jgi:hypothetical protein
MYYQQQVSSQPLRCYNHQQFAATGQCQQCGTPGCTHCLQWTGYSNLCRNCLSRLNAQQQVHEAKRKITNSWLVTFIAGGLLAVPSLLYSMHALVTVGAVAGIAGLLQCVFTLYTIWSLYWGWGILRNACRNILGDTGCLIWGTIPFWVVFGVITLGLATTIGAFGGGIYQYFKAREIVRLAQQV